MKFSELTTDRAMDVLCEIVPYIENITSDDELLTELKKKMELPDDVTNAEKISITMSKLKVIAPILLKKRRDDVLGIIASVNCKKVDEVRKQSIIKTMLDIKELIQDKDFMDFFKSFAGLVGGVQ